MRFRKIVLQSKIIIKTRTIINQENYAQRFRDNYLANNLVKFLQKKFVAVNIPGVLQKRPPEWIRNISKTTLVFLTFLCRKGGLGYFKVIKFIPKLLMTTIR